MRGTSDFSPAVCEKQKELRFVGPNAAGRGGGVGGGADRTRDTGTSETMGVCFQLGLI